MPAPAPQPALILPPSVDTLTFDCYGTLIDWRGGLQASFLSMFGPAARPLLAELFEAYVSTEAEVEALPWRPYREVLAAVAERLAERFRLPLPPEGGSALPRLLPQWPAFADTNDALRRLKTRFRLGVLSNIDRDLFAATARQFSVPIDFLVSAEDVRGYKPGPGHFDRLLRDHATAERVLHVAQSQFHDGTACRRHGLSFVWINRYGDPRDPAVPMLGEFPDLRSFAGAVVGT